MSASPAIAAIVLAAGASRRFGADNKLLAEIDSQPMVARVIAAIETAGIDRVVIVTGHEADLVTAATAGAARTHVFNPRHGEGMGTSVAAGIAALGAGISGALIAQGDMPGVDAALVAALCRRFREAACEAIVFPRLADGRQGNPVVWPRRLFGALSGLTGDRGGKALIDAEADRAIALTVTGDAAARDIDTPEALADYRTTRSSQPS